MMSSDSSAKSVAVNDSSPSVASTDSGEAAFADIYFRDGLSYLKIGDLQSARDCFRRSLDYDPERGLTLAYRAYTSFKIEPNSESAREECRQNLRRSIEIEPDNPEIHVLTARFAVNIGEKERAVEAVERIQNLHADHPKLQRLWKRIEKM